MFGSHTVMWPARRAGTNASLSINNELNEVDWDTVLCNDSVNAS